MRVLFITFERFGWAAGSCWSYSTQLNIPHSMSNLDYDVTTAIILTETQVSREASWNYVKQLYENESFDLVWIEGMHSQLNECDISWIKNISPIRICQLIESATETPCHSIPMNTLLERLKVYTHILCIDENDVDNLNSQDYKCYWFNHGISEDFVTYDYANIGKQYAVFMGKNYAVRQILLDSIELRDRLKRIKSLEFDTDLPIRFEQNNYNFFMQFINNSLRYNSMKEYVDNLTIIRENIFLMYLESLQQGYAVVSLPHTIKAYPGRVWEAIAAGVPLITWEITNRKEVNTLFEKDKEVLTFIHPEAHIEDWINPYSIGIELNKVDKDREFGMELANNARNRLLKDYTTEKIIQDIVSWAGE